MASLRPELVGREGELEELRRHLEDAATQRGSVVFLSGEAGIGKSRLVEELQDLAISCGFTILSGSCLYESLTPYFPFLEALREGGMESLFAEEAPRVEGVYLVTASGVLVKEAVRRETPLDPNLFASMLAIVRKFMSDSMSLMTGKEPADALRRLDYGPHCVIIEEGTTANLAVVLTGKENEFLVSDMRATVARVDQDYGAALAGWNGDEDGVRNIESLIRPLIEKYDGAYYGSENPQARRNLLFEQVALGLARQAKSSPTLLCLEDAQWADPSTLALVHYVARNTRDRGLMILVTYRPEDLVSAGERPHPLTEILRMMEREDLCRRMELGRLSLPATTRILETLFGESGDREDLAKRMHAETEGNPLFLVELLRMMAAEGVIVLDDGRWRLTKGPGEISIPSRVRDVILRRLERVEAEQLEILTVASVIGEEFASDLLASASGLERIRVLRGLGVLQQKHRLIRPREGGYRFDHAIIRDVLYVEIPPELRMEYHAAIGDAIGKLRKESSDEVVGELAFHYYRCRDRKKALPYLLRAAERAGMEYANAEAIQFYTEALELEDDAENRRKLLEGLGSVYQVIGAYGESLDCYEKALDLAVGKGKKAEILTWVGWLHFRRGEYEKCMQKCTEALTLVRGDGSKEEALAISRIGATQNVRGEYDAALESYERSLEICEKVSDLEGIARSLNNIGVIHNSRGDYDEALEYYQKSHGICERIGERNLIAGSLNSLGDVNKAKGDYDAALEYYGRSLELREKIGDRRGMASTLTSIGEVHSNRGNCEAALDCYRRSLETCEKIGDRSGIARALNAIGDVHKARGEPEVALAVYMQSLEIRENIGDRNGIATTLANLGGVQTLKGDYDAALGYFRKSLRISSKAGERGASGESYAGIAEVKLLQGDLAEASDFCGLALSLSENTGQKELIAMARRISGMISRERRMWRESIENFEKGIAICREIGQRPAEAKARYEFGLMWMAYGDNSRARGELSASAHLFETLKLEAQCQKAMDACRIVSTGLNA